MSKKYFSIECMYSMILTVHGFSTQRFGIDYEGLLPEEDDREDAIVVLIELIMEYLVLTTMIYV